MDRERALIAAEAATGHGPIDDWDDAYANAAHIPGAQDYPARWEADAAAFRAAASASLDLPYGPGARERFDLFRPAGDPRGLAVFIHGGYWMKFDKSFWSHLAAGPVARGWAVAMPSYPLAPEARIGEITAAIARFLTEAAALVAGPIHLSGHSAGGHLASRLLCADAPVAEQARWRIAQALSISGVHDLRPLLRTSMNATLGLDEPQAQAESPALLRPVEGARLHAWAGAAERPEFVRQSALLANIWTGLGADTRLTVAPDRHHFDVIEGLADPDAPLCDALLSW